MNDIDISVDQETISYAINGVKGWFKKDFATTEERRWLEELISVATVESSTIQCVGMPKPVPLGEIHIETGLQAEQKTVPLDSLVNSQQNAIILAGPGNGKTTFLRWAFITLLSRRSHIPILITLRRPGAVDNLNRLISCLRDGMAARALKEIATKRLILLIDGYDEIDAKSQKKVSELILQFEAMKSGNYYLTCRSFYTVYELKAPHYSIAPFSRPHASIYVRKLAGFFNPNLNADALLNELDAKGFSSFAEHPLLLTLVVILKSTAAQTNGPPPTIPSNSIGLIRRAVEVLSFRWDQEKGINRESACDIDAPDREQCLMLIAYKMNLPSTDEQQVISLTWEFLRLLNRSDLNAEKLLDELAKFYGLLIPGDGEKWTFTHRTIHDYLAAKYWVENVHFDPKKVHVWTTRAAYAGSLLHDATETIEVSLKREHGMNVFMECVTNTRRYDRHRVAEACIAHFTEFPELREIKMSPSGVSVELSETDWIKSVEDALLDSMLISSLSAKSHSHIAVLSLALSERLRRNRLLKGELLHQLRQRFDKPSFAIRIVSQGKADIKFTLKELIDTPA